MTRLGSSLLAGLLFGLGLALAGMTLPSRVLGFLDVTGPWDPSLALVMVSAIAVHLPLQRVIRGRGRPLFDTRFHLPTGARIDRRLVVGSALFGVGWGLAGSCPGPALVSAATGAPWALSFVAAMAVGMVAQRVLAPERGAHPPSPSR